MAVVRVVLPVERAVSGQQPLAGITMHHQQVAGQESRPVLHFLAGLTCPELLLIPRSSYSCSDASLSRVLVHAYKLILPPESCTP